MNILHNVLSALASVGYQYYFSLDQGDEALPKAL